MAKNILIVSRNIYFSNSPRSIRWLKFIKYMGEKYETIVVSKYKIPKEVLSDFSANVMNYSIKDYEFNGNNKAKFLIHNSNEKPKSPLYYSVRNMLKRIYNTIIFPDKYWFWCIEAFYKVLLLNKEIKKRIDVIICPSPAQSNLLAGYFIRKICEGKLIFDIGDPWAYNPSSSAFRWRQKIDKIAEKFLLNKADRIIVNTKQLAKLYNSKFQIDEAKLRCIYNGADKITTSNDFRLGRRNRDKFSIHYTGNFYDKIREPYNFFNAIASLDSDMQLDIKIAGNVYTWFIDFYKRLNSKIPINFLGRLKHNRALEMQESSDLLLLFSNKSEYQLPSKIFEYLVTGRPILVISYNPDEDIVLKNFRDEEGISYVKNDSEKIKDKIVELYQVYINNELQKIYNRKDYAWHYRYLELENLLNEI